MLIPKQAIAAVGQGGVFVACTTRFTRLSTLSESRRGRATLPSDRVCARASNGMVDPPESATQAEHEWPLPNSVNESVNQAKGACIRALAAGKARLEIDLLLPLIGATDLDDWPGGIKQQYLAAEPLVGKLLRSFLEGAPSSAFGGCKPRVIDDGDAVVAWESDQVALVLFPTAETLPEIQRIGNSFPDRPLLLVNPQWQPGQVISDFGFGAKRKAAEEFLSTFEFVYGLKTSRIRSADVRILKCFPGKWQVHLAKSDGSTTCLSLEDKRPSYKRLEEILKQEERKNNDGSQGWLQRIVTEFNFNKDSLR